MAAATSKRQLKPVRVSMLIVTSSLQLLGICHKRPDACFLLYRPTLAKSPLGVEANVERQ
jgi:hypothetical protein